MDARTTRYGADDLDTVLDGIRTVHAARGKSVRTLDLQDDAVDDDAIAKAMLGPTGNLRAPTFRVGRVLLVGFHEATYEDVLT